MSLRSTPSSVFRVSPSRARAHDDLAAFQQIEIEDVRRIAHLPKHVVGGVDSVVDRPLIEQCQALR